MEENRKIRKVFINYDYDKEKKFNRNSSCTQGKLAYERRQITSALNKKPLNFLICFLICFIIHELMNNELYKKVSNTTYSSSNFVCIPD